MVTVTEPRSIILRKGAEIGSLTSLLEDKRERIQQRYRRGLVAFILIVEKAWERYAFSRVLNPVRAARDLNHLLSLIQHTYIRNKNGQLVRGSTGQLRMKPGLLNQKARYYAKKWNWLRLYIDDFEDNFSKDALDIIIEKYSWTSEFYLYETLDRSFDNRARDMARKAQNKYNRPHHQALPLANGFEQFYPDERVNVENKAVNRRLMEQLIDGKIISNTEQQYLANLYLNHDAKFIELATLIGKKHHQEAIRIEKKIGRTIAKIINN